MALKVLLRNGEQATVCMSSAEDGGLVAGCYLWFGCTKDKTFHLWRPDGGWREFDSGTHPQDIVKGIPSVY